MKLTSTLLQQAVSDNRFDVIEQSVEDHFAKVEENLRDHIKTSENHFIQVEDSQRDHVTSSDSHFSQVDKSLGEITTTIQVILC